MFEAIFLFVEKSGWVFYPLFLAGLCGWYFIFEILIYLRNEKRFYGENLKGCDANYLSTLKKAECVIEHSSEKTLAEIDEVITNILSNDIHKRFDYIKTILVLASLAPLLGLLGTVNGMIETFKTISEFGNANPILMADGISEALLTTQEGLTIAFPLMFFAIVLKSKLMRIKNRINTLLLNYKNSLVLK